MLGLPVLLLQLGHQAANCTTGTVNWRQMYGENAFSMRPAIFQSDLDAAKKSKQIDFEDLEKRARDYAKVGAGAGSVAGPGQLWEGGWGEVEVWSWAQLPRPLKGWFHQWLG